LNTPIEILAKHFVGWKTALSTLVILFAGRLTL